MTRRNKISKVNKQPEEYQRPSAATYKIKLKELDATIALYTATAKANDLLDSNEFKELIAGLNELRDLLIKEMKELGIEP